jgi:hypothetical protein
VTAQTMKAIDQIKVDRSTKSVPTEIAVASF